MADLSVERALSDPERIEMLDHLFRLGQTSESQLAEMLKMRRGKVRYHLDLLVDAGLVIKTKTPEDAELEPAFKPAVSNLDLIPSARREDAPSDRRYEQVARFAEILSDPLRIAIVNALGEGHASPEHLAEALGKPLSQVSGQVRIMRRLGFVRPAALVPSDQPAERPYESTFAGAGVGCISTTLDARGWAEVLAALWEAEKRIGELIRGETRRLARRKGRGIPGTVILASFGSAPSRIATFEGPSAG